MVTGDQRLVHTPFVPSGSWSPCARLLWNQGFPTPLGGLSMFTNPVRAPDILFSSSQFGKQHPRHEKAGVYPARLRKVIIIEPPFWFRAPFNVLRLFVREKMRDRVSF
ncbi:unnamed protein product [Schistosoma margrebowiei]|uniref:Uncharacterized protein n=1 Tax=Schistosoma margrebowiei TaxID=48269 RepID=A0A183MYW9_9TREM|nr:unnamed protein product [Schistosoma margrebowiei]